MVLVVAGIVALLLLGDAVSRAGWGEMLLLAPWVLLVLWAIWATMFASMIETDAEGVTVQNYLRRTRLPWGVVTDIRLRYQIVFVLGDEPDERRVKALGGPVVGRPVRPVLRGGTREHPALREMELIRERWRSALDRGAADGVVVRSWDWMGFGAFAMIVAWALVAVLVAGRAV